MDFCGNTLFLFPDGNMQLLKISVHWNVELWLAMQNNGNWHVIYHAPSYDELEYYIVNIACQSLWT